MYSMYNSYRRQSLVVNDFEFCTWTYWHITWWFRVNRFSTYKLTSYWPLHMIFFFLNIQLKVGEVTLDFVLIASIWDNIPLISASIRSKKEKKLCCAQRPTHLKKKKKSGKFIQVLYFCVLNKTKQNKTKNKNGLEKKKVIQLSDPNIQKLHLKTTIPQQFSCFGLRLGQLVKTGFMLA